MIDLESFKGLAQIDLGPFGPKPTCLEGDQQEAAVSLWTSPDGALDVGVWECTPGRFTADRSAAAELCHIISGTAELRRHDGEVRVLNAGDLLVLPRGWKGEWVIREQVRKLYVMQGDPK